MPNKIIMMVTIIIIIIIRNVYERSCERPLTVEGKQTATAAFESRNHNDHCGGSSSGTRRVKATAAESCVLRHWAVHGRSRRAAVAAATRAAADRVYPAMQAVQLRSAADGPAPNWTWPPFAGLEAWLHETRVEHIACQRVDVRGWIGPATPDIAVLHLQLHRRSDENNLITHRRRFPMDCVQRRIRDAGSMPAAGHRRIRAHGRNPENKSTLN